MTPKDKKLFGTTEAFLALIIVASAMMTGKKLADVEALIHDENILKSKGDHVFLMKENPAEAYRPAIMKKMAEKKPQIVL